MLILSGDNCSVQEMDVREEPTSPGVKAQGNATNRNKKLV